MRSIKNINQRLYMFNDHIQSKPSSKGICLSRIKRQAKTRLGQKLSDNTVVIFPNKKMT